MQRIRSVIKPISMVVVAWLIGSLPARAQWLTQTNALNAGWNAVFLHVDASHTTLTQLVGSDPSNPIQEVWYWVPALPTGQFIDSPQLPTSSGNQWVSWTRALGPASALQRLGGDGAYLPPVTNTAASYNWTAKSKPVRPPYPPHMTAFNSIALPTP